MLRTHQQKRSPRPRPKRRQWHRLHAAVDFAIWCDLVSRVTFERGQGYKPNIPNTSKPPSKKYDPLCILSYSLHWGLTMGSSSGNNLGTQSNNVCCYYVYLDLFPKICWVLQHRFTLLHFNSKSLESLWQPPGQKSDTHFAKCGDSSTKA